MSEVDQSGNFRVTALAFVVQANSVCCSLEDRGCTCLKESESARAKVSFNFIFCGLALKVIVILSGIMPEASLAALQQICLAGISNATWTMVKASKREESPKTGSCRALPGLPKNN